MKLIPEFERLNSGEHNSRIITVNVDSLYWNKKVKIGFVTPMGKVFITDEIKLTEGSAQYVLPYELLDGKGLLLAQLIVYEDEKYVIKSPVYELPVYASVDDMSCPCVTPEGVKSLAFLYEVLMTKSDIGHRHDDIYFTEGEINGLLALKSDITHLHDDRYFTESEINGLLEKKSNVGHVHDDRYYTESEADGLLEGKSDVGHTHDDRYYTGEVIDALLITKSNSDHHHDSRYYTKEQAEKRLTDSLNAGLAGKSDKGHSHSWNELEDKPGNVGREELISLQLDDLSRNGPGIFVNEPWIQTFELDSNADIVPGELLNVRVSPADSEDVYIKECRFLPDFYDPYSLYLSFNNTEMTEEDIINGTGNIKGASPEDSSMPAFLLMKQKSDLFIVCAANYENTVIEIARITCVKLTNDALNVTDKVTEDSEELITSGGVYAALGIAEAGSVTSVNGQTGSVILDASDVHALPDTTVIPAVPERISAFTNDAGYALKTEVSSAVNNHNKDSVSHSDMRSLIENKSDANHTHSFSDLSDKPSLNGITLEGETDVDGLMYRRVLTSADDFNNILEDGVYVYSTSSVPKNAPFANAAVVEVFGAKSNTTQKIQRAYRYGTTGYSAFRPLYAGNWLEWTASVDQVIEQGTDGNWNYRKWSSGRMEAWGNLNATVTEISVSSVLPGIVSITAQVKFPTGMLTGESNVEYCSLQARNYKIFGNMSGISSNNLWGRFTTYTGVDTEYPVGNTSFAVHANITGRWK